MEFKTKILAMLLIPNALGSTLFMPDSDTVALIHLVSNTAATVSNTLKILEVAEETSSQIDKYNFLAMRRYFIARRIEQHVNDIVAASKLKPKDLRELNHVMLTLKMNLKGLKSNIDYMAKDLYEAENFVDSFYAKVVNSLEDEREAHNQELVSASEGNMSKHVQNTAMNTAMSTKILSKIRRDSLEYQKHAITIQKGDLTEKLRREHFYKKWLEIEDETLEEAL